MSWYGEWRPYVPVAKRRAKAAAYATRVAEKEKRTLCPVKITGRKIASSFWGQAWCENLERYSDFANRLPRGRTYARNGSVIDLQINRGKIQSIVSGSDVYRVEIEITVLKKALWDCLKRDCSSSVDSLLDLLQGRFDQGVMTRLTQQNDGLFPQPKEIKMRCSCPDWAGLCKHIAATFYGVGARLDAAPDLLFSLRGVDHLELIGEAVGRENLDRALGNTTGTALGDLDLGEVFGIDIEPSTTGASTADESRRSTKRKVPIVKARNRQSATSSSLARSGKVKQKPTSKVGTDPGTAQSEKEAKKRSSSPLTNVKKRAVAKSSNKRKQSESAKMASTTKRHPTPKPAKKQVKGQ